MTQSQDIETLERQLFDDPEKLSPKSLQEYARAWAEAVAALTGKDFGETDLQSALLIAERLRQLVLGLNLPHAASRLGMRVTVSIGCATMDSATGITKAAELLQKADSMLYQAKKLGRNRVYAG